MKLNPKYGIDQLLFGMKQTDVVGIYGPPDRQFLDDEENTIILYNQHKLRLTFYKEEEFKLGYIITSNPAILLLDKRIMGKNIDEVKRELPFKSWEKENFDASENHFNESNWLTLQSEYEEVIKVELGAIINDKDEFDWKFKK